MGSGKSSGSSSATLTPEQTELLKTQTDALKNTFLPAYEKTVGGAGDVLSAAQPYVNDAAKNLYSQAGQVSNEAMDFGNQLAAQGQDTLSTLFSPDYEKNQINAALQAGRESARESQMGQNAMYGAAGGLGSARQALADSNMASLNAQRQATAAAGAQAQVQAQRAALGQYGVTQGTNTVLGSLNATGQQIAAAQAPTDLYSKYASIVYGVPQGNTTANFAGTQGSNTSSKGFKI